MIADIFCAKNKGKLYCYEIISFKDAMGRQIVAPIFCIAEINTGLPCLKNRFSMFDRNLRSNVLPDISYKINI